MTCWRPWTVTSGFRFRLWRGWSPKRRACLRRRQISGETVPPPASETELSSPASKVPVTLPPSRSLHAEEAFALDPALGVVASPRGRRPGGGRCHGCGEPRGLRGGAGAVGAATVAATVVGDVLASARAAGELPPSSTVVASLQGQTDELSRGQLLLVQVYQSEQDALRGTAAASTLEVARLQLELEERPALLAAVEQRALAAEKDPELAAERHREEVERLVAQVSCLEEADMLRQRELTSLREE